MPFKIRRKEDGLFSSGRTYPSFSKKGKTWNGLAALCNHLSLNETYCYSYRGAKYRSEEIEIVEMEMVQIAVMDFTTFEEDRKKRRDKRNMVQDRRRAKRRVDAAKRELAEATKRVEKLKKEVGEI